MTDCPIGANLDDTVEADRLREKAHFARLEAERERAAFTWKMER